MMALAGVELEALVSETDALTTRPPSNKNFIALTNLKQFWRIKYMFAVF